MLTTRSVIIAIVAAAVLSVVAALGALLVDGDTHSTLGRDTYGTRTEGYRGIHDLLAALGFETARTVLPAVPPSALDTSYVVWNPRDQFVQTEPTFLNDLSKWVRAGGHLVVTPSADAEDSSDSACPRCSGESCSTCIPVSLLGELGLSGVVVDQVELQSPDESLSSGDSSADTFRETVRDVFQVQKRPSAAYPISCQGEWDELSSQARHVEMPLDQAWQISTEEVAPLAEVAVEGWGEEGVATLAAMFPLGKGRITLISNPWLASNASLSEADNSVLLTRLITDGRKRVVFDEFYHGLTVRGNALWLLSKRPYAIIGVAVLAVVGMAVWRSAVFLGPSREALPVSRRTLGEYLEAMSRFLLKGRQSSKYILRELRDGVLWHYCKALGLPPQQQNADIVLGRLAKRSPQEASQLEAALQDADRVLSSPRARKNEILAAMRKVSDCLSR